MACLILVFSVVALAQFSFFSWRAGLLANASQQLSGRMQEAWGYSDNSLKAGDFHDLAALYHVCHSMEKPERQLWLLQLYYSLAKHLGHVASLFVPEAAKWANREMLACVRCVAVGLDQRLEQMQVCAASARSY